MAILLWTTAALSLMGLVSTAVVAVRKDGRAAILLLPFGGVLLHQTPMLLATPQMGLTLDTQTLQAGALLLVALGSFATLLGLSRIAGERNSAEELHWDAMEVIRASNELARPGHEETGLAELLAIGARHFEMGFGAILPPDGGEPHGVHASPGLDIDVAAGVEALRLYDEWHTERAFVEEGRADLPLPLARVFVTSLYIRGERVGTLGYASPSPGRRPLTATDKDLLTLLAGVATGALASGPAQESAKNAEATPLPAPTLETTHEPPRATVSQTAPSAHDHVRNGLDGATAELELGPELAQARGPRVPIEEVARGLAEGARGVSPNGSWRVESGSTHSPMANAHFITLTLHIDDPSLDASSLGTATSPDGAAIEALARRLRAHDGDVSLSVESGVGASLTAYVPVEPPEPEPATRAVQFAS